MEIEPGGLPRPVGVQLRMVGEALDIEGPPAGDVEALSARARLEPGCEPGDDVALPGLGGVEEIVVPHSRERQSPLEIDIRLGHRRSPEDDSAEKTDPLRDPSASHGHAGTTEVQSTSTATLLFNRSTESTRNPLSAFRRSRIPSTPASGPLVMRTRIPSFRKG